jgi:hypothetical protein
MKNTIKILFLILGLTITACSSITVYADYELTAPFEQYKTYNFSKKEIDKVEISTLDKKRILKALESELEKRGFIKSIYPDLMVSFFVNSQQEVNVWNNNNFGWGWGFNNTQVSTFTTGNMFINFVSTSTNDLVWQGQGSGALEQDPEKKEIMIRAFVEQILNQYPPN